MIMVEIMNIQCEYKIVYDITDQGITGMETIIKANNQSDAFEKFMASVEKEPNMKDWIVIKEIRCLN